MRLLRGYGTKEAKVSNHIFVCAKGGAFTTTPNEYKEFQQWLNESKNLSIFDVFKLYCQFRRERKKAA